jgi:hypothetical protein
VQAYLPKLQELHTKRAADSPDFNFIKEQIDRTRVLREREQISLNEAIVKAEREELKRSEFEAENLRRQLKGLPLKEWIDEDAEAELALSESSESSDERSNDSSNDNSETSAALASTTSSDDESEEPEEPEELDPLLLESGRILADFINLSSGSLSAR